MSHVGGFTIDIDGTVWLTVELGDGVTEEVPIELARLKDWVDWLDRLHRGMVEMADDVRDRSFKWSAQEIIDGASKASSDGHLIVKLHTAEGGPTDGA